MGRDREAGEAGCGLALLSNFSRPWSTQLYPGYSYLVPGPGGIRAGEVDGGPEYEAQ